MIIDIGIDNNPHHSHAMDICSQVHLVGRVQSKLLIALIEYLTY